MPFADIPRVYLTLLCNLRCPYCSDGRAYDKTDMGYPTLSAEEWTEIINRLPGDAVIFTGGEPALHPGLADIVNGIRQQRILLYTNLAYNVPKLLDRFRKPVTFFTSFHPSNPRVTLDASLATLRALQVHPMCAGIVSHHVVRHPSNGSEKEIRAVRRAFSRVGVQLLVYDDQNRVNVYGSDACDHRARRLVECRARRIVIGPDGRRHFCVSKMVRKAGDRYADLNEPEPRKVCSEFGLCSPCDEASEIRFLGPPAGVSVPDRSPSIAREDAESPCAAP